MSAPTAANPTPGDPAHELLASVDAWLWKYSSKLARYYRLDASELRQNAIVRILRVPNQFDPARGSVTTWVAWHVRGAASEMLRHEARARRCGFLPGEMLDTFSATYDDAEGTPYADHLADALAELPERYQQVLRLRHGITDDDTADADPETLASIGDRFGVSRERIRQIEAIALTRLRTALIDRAHPPHRVVA